MTLELGGIHHLTAITAEAGRNMRFYTQTLGMRLVKKTVNQDDVSAYHLFYGDGEARPGSDLTFFDWPAPREGRGTHSIVRTGLRVAGSDSLSWWEARLRAEGVMTEGMGELDGRACLAFEDFEGQRLVLVDDGGDGDAAPWLHSPVPAEHQIRGLGPVTISVPKLERSEPVLQRLLGMRKERLYEQDGKEVHVFAMAKGGPAAELHVMVEPGAPFASQGAGGAHHVAFRAKDKAELEAWTRHLSEAGIRTSGEVERYYFRSLYFREPSGILFEIATDGPGFAVDEPLESLGRKLALPPFLEGRRASIEAGLKPL